MKQRIREVFKKINNNMVNDVSLSFEKRIQVWLNHNGVYFEDLLYFYFCLINPLFLFQSLLYLSFDQSYTTYWTDVKVAMNFQSWIYR